MGSAALISMLVLVCLGMGFRRLVQAVHLQDTPVSRNRSAAQGMVELQGITGILPGPSIVAPLTKTPCVWWQYRVTRTRDADSGARELEVIADETSSDCFEIADATGKCIVDPVGARVIPTLSRVWRGASAQPARVPRPGWDAFFTFGNYRFSEKIIPLGDLLLVHGFFRSRSALVGPGGEVADLLSQWKHDRHTLLQRFDANRDGEIDQAEWEDARSAALNEVHERYLEQAASPELSVIGPPPRGGEFVISAIRRPSLIKHYERQAVAFLLAAMLLTSLLASNLVRIQQLSP